MPTIKGGFSTKNPEDIKKAFTLAGWKNEKKSHAKKVEHKEVKTQKKTGRFAFLK